MKKSSVTDKPPHQRSRNGGSHTQPRTLGPVRNLEAHVTSEWWRVIFNPLYLKTDADVVADAEITQHEVDILLDIIRPTKDTRILDLCCGQGRHVFEMHRRGIHSIEGLDRSHYLIQKARKQARSEGLPLRFKEGDARKIPHTNESFDIVMILGNSFGYFETVEDDLRVLREVMRVLTPAGTLILDLTDGDYLRSNYQPRSWEWADKKLFVCRERALSADGERLITREIISHTQKGVLADQFYAERLYNKETIAHLIQEAGFTAPVLHETFVPASRRNQDLGMMAQRILLTCTADKLWMAETAISSSAIRNVVVILGDPNKPDDVKPHAVFDDDDFHTIGELQTALEGFSQRHYSYIQNHQTMLTDLSHLGSDVDLVFNLCDEGFNNNPRWELHVPALLEMLGLPYTGSSPQCLAFCYDKSLVRGVAKEMGIPVAEGFLVRPDETTFDLPVPFPVIVKPNFGDSSFGIIQRSVVQSPEELINAVTEIRQRFGYDKPILVEEFLMGQDLSVGILGNPPEDYMVLPIIEEDYSMLPEGLPHICGYEAKWLPDSPYWNLRSIPADLSDETRSLIIDACVRLFVRLECRDYCRFDWRIGADGKPKLLEVNPNPGWCWDGHLAKMASIAGMSYAEMLETILQSANKRLRMQVLSLATLSHPLNK
jgi:D-alanine-D-alanine ligase